MAKPEWGTKRICQSCGARFYDFGRSPILCPTCGAVFDLEILNRSRRTRPSVRAVAAETGTEPVAEIEAETETELEEAEEEVAVEEAEDVVETEDGEEDDSLIEDASELGDDEDMSDVIEGGIDEETR